VTFYVIEMWATKGEPHSAHVARLEAAAQAKAPPGGPPQGGGAH
jgi:hypothetical protein